MGTIDVVGSKMPTFASEQTQKSNRGFGQNGYSGSSSVPPKQGRAISKTYAGLATDTMNVTVSPGDWQTRTISAKPTKASPTMRNPNASPAKVPTTLLSRSVPPSVQPAKKGSYNR